jgi:hypothetical protein
MDLFSQIDNHKIEIEIINDILPDFLSDEINCFYLFDKNGYQMITKSRIDKFKNILDTIIPIQIVDDILKRATNYVDKNSKWGIDEINNSILLTDEELYNKIHFHLFEDTITVVKSNLPDCKEFEILYDSSNIDKVLDFETGKFIVDTLDYYYPVKLVPNEFYSVYFITYPTIDSTGNYAIFTYGVNPHTLMGFGCYVICQKKNDKWIIIQKFNCFAS